MLEIGSIQRSGAQHLNTFVKYTQHVLKQTAHVAEMDHAQRVSFNIDKVSDKHVLIIEFF